MNRTCSWLVAAHILIGCSDPTNNIDDDDDTLLVPSMTQVYLMAGQSNMEGYGPLKAQDATDWPMSESLEELIERGDEDASIMDAREDIWVHFDNETALSPAFLRPGYGADERFLGPELGLGHQLGDAIDTPIVLYKSAVGGSTLGGDWLPPSAALTTGVQAGPLYEAMINGFNEFLGDGVKHGFPEEIATDGYSIAGFIWLQGWNDQFEDGYVEQYEDNLVALVEDVRSDLDLPSLTAIIVEGPTLDEELRTARINAVARLESKQANSVRYVETHDLVQEEIEGNFHFHFNAGNYLEVGRRTAQSILK